MIKSSAIDLLKVLKKDELKPFHDFLSSPFHNTSKSVVKLYELLVKLHPEYEMKSLTKEEIFKHVYKDKEYNEQTMKTLLFNLSNLVKDFISYTAYLNRPVQVKQDLITELMQRESFSTAEKSFKDLKKQIESKAGLNDDVIKNRMDFEILCTQFNLKSNKQGASLNNIKNQADHHIMFSLMRLANFVHDLKVNSIIFNFDYSDTLTNVFIKNLELKETLEYLQANRKGNDLNEITEYHIYRLLFYAAPNEKYYKHLKELAVKNLEQYDAHEKYNTLQTLEAVCWMLKQEADRKKYDKELYELYKMRLKLGVFSPEGKTMRVILYRTILLSLLTHGTDKEIEKYIAEYIPKLPASHRENMMNFSSSLYHFKKGEYEKVLESAIKINFEMFTFKYDVRLLMFKVYYELDYIEEAFSLIDTHKHFIKLNKGVSDYYKEIHDNFLKFYNTLLKYKLSRNYADASFLSKKISALNNIAEKEWLLGKAGEMAEKNT